jgi:hypothetical protein
MSVGYRGILGYWTRPKFCCASSAKAEGPFCRPEQALFLIVIGYHRPSGRMQDPVLLTAWGLREIFGFKLRGTMLGIVLKH